MTTKFVGIRLPLPVVHKLEKIAEQYNLTPNKMAKNAIIDWVEIFFSARNLNMITMPNELFVDYLGKMSDEEMKKHAKNIAEKTLGFHEFLSETSETRDSLERAFPIIVRFLGPKGLMWFEHLEYEIEKKPFYLKGIHNFGMRWSEFFMEISKSLTKAHFPYQINEKKCRLTSHSAHIVFE